MSKPNPAKRKDQPQPTSPGKTSSQPRPKSDPNTGTTGMGSSEGPKGPGSLSVKSD
jgi:hypothetical protein